MKPAYKKPFILTLSSLGIAGVVCAFIVWEIHSDNLTVPQQSLAGVSALLFILVGIRTVVKWADDWSAGEALTVCRQSFSWKLFFTLVFWDILVLFLAWPLRCVLLEPMTLGQSMERWVCGDGVHYWHIARDWYLSSGSIDRVVQLVFLPGYPLLIRLFHLLIPNWTYAALTVSGLCFALAGTVLYSGIVFLLRSHEREFVSALLRLLLLFRTNKSLDSCRHRRRRRRVYSFLGYHTDGSNGSGTCACSHTLQPNPAEVV